MKLKKLLLSFIILLLLLIGLFVPFRTALVFYKENTDYIEAFLPIQKGDTFQIIFKHSIHLKDVVEKYKVTDDLQIKQYEFVYEEFGIGMPSNAQEGESFVYEDGKYHIRDIDRIFPFINVRNGKTVSKNRLVWGTEDSEEEHMVWFNEYFKPGAWFTIKVERISLWEYLKGVKIHD
ncbi:DUF1850 domain-containing protein [Oceanobacillus senegalensis]|uniref:DUF1850 domain-containing protein n=1 Tax=Oceanobacillus senegalensis TaxID=1936063 RepID=UPI000A3143ED|nr:DUF1850 domain-containing protein [Oceanobacillus senegalensis]